MDEHLKTARQAFAKLDLQANAAFTAAGQEFAADLRVLTIEKESLEKVLAAARAEFDASRDTACARIEAAARRAAEQPAPTLPTSTANEPVRSP